MKIELDVERITIVRDFGADQLFFRVNLPDGRYPFKEKAVLKMYVAKDKGEEYVKEHFPTCEYKIISV